MFEKIAEYITNRWMNHNVIRTEEREVYQFGIKQLLEFLFSGLAVIGLGIVFSELAGCLIFSATFISLRMYAGGYHASTPIRCFVMTVFVTAASLSAIKYLDISVLCCVVVLILSAGVILRLSPVESSNKWLDNIERAVYRKKCGRIWCIQMLCAAAGLAAGYQLAAGCIAAAHMAEAAALIMGKIQRGYAKN